MFSQQGLASIGPCGLNGVMEQRLHLIRLVDLLAAHHGVTHFAISMRALGKGDFFKNLKKPNGDCRTQTASRLMRWFSDNWPADLEWPADIPRPTPSKKEAA